MKAPVGYRTQRGRLAARAVLVVASVLIPLLLATALTASAMLGIALLGTEGGRVVGQIRGWHWGSLLIVGWLVTAAVWSVLALTHALLHRYAAHAHLRW